MKTLHKLLILAAVVASGLPSFGQVTLTQTSLSTAVASNAAGGQQQIIQVASATGINAPSPFQATGTAGVATQLYIDDEILDVERVSGTFITVRRGANGTRVRAHQAGSNVYVIQLQFQNGVANAAPLGGACPIAPAYVPFIDYKDAETFNCPNGQWILETIAGSQHLAVQLAVGAAGYTNATTAYSNVTNLAFPAQANQTYTLSCNVVWSASATTAGPKFQVTGPASPTAVLLAADGGTGAAAYADAAVTAFSTGITAFGTAGAASTNYVLHLNLSVINGVTPGTVAIQAAANGSGTVTIQPGSYCSQL